MCSNVPIVVKRGTTYRFFIGICKVMRLKKHSMFISSNKENMEYLLKTVRQK